MGGVRWGWCEVVVDVWLGSGDHVCGVTFFSLCSEYSTPSYSQMTIRGQCECVRVPVCKHACMFVWMRASE